MKHLMKLGRGSRLFLTISILCACAVLGILLLYYHVQQNPYMQQSVFDLSSDWDYLDKSGQLCSLPKLELTPSVAEHEVFTVQKTLDIPVSGAALLLTRNHQTVTLRLDGVSFFAAGLGTPSQNPGMELHFVPLPEDYLGKTLVMEVSSPYPQYAGRLNPLYLGDIPSLEAYATARSMPSVIWMSICVFLGLCTIVLTVLHTLHDRGNRASLAMGVFAVLWGLYYVCTEPIAYQFLNPVQMSLFSIGLYFALPAPLSLFFYYSSQHIKRSFFVSACLHSSFLLVAMLLQITGVIPLVYLLNLNNLLYLLGLTYLIVLCVVEALKHNRIMLLSSPFLVVAYLSIVVEFILFYSTRKPVNYAFFKNAFTLMILISLGYEAIQFFKRYYTQHMEAKLLALQNRLALENYQQLQQSIDQTRLLKHEMNGHLSALQLLLESQDYMRANTYLKQVLLQAEQIATLQYCAHFLVNGMLCGLVTDAESQGVALDLRVHVPEQLGIADSDLHSLLSNIITNAMEACATVEPLQERSLQLTIGIRDLYLVISCQNSRNPKIILDSALSSTKTDGGHHGYGMRIIQSIVKKYNGSMSYEVGDQHFTLSLALKQEPLMGKTSRSQK